MSRPRTALEQAMPTRFTRRIAYLFNKGLTPNRIDERHGLSPGSAVRAISRAWGRDKRYAAMESDHD